MKFVEKSRDPCQGGRAYPWKDGRGGGVAERPTAVLTEIIITNRKIHPFASRKQDYSICIFGQHTGPHLLDCANAVKVRQE